MKKYTFLFLFMISAFCSMTGQVGRDTLVPWTGEDIFYTDMEITFDSISVLCDEANATATDTTCYCMQNFDWDSIFVTGYSHLKVVGSFKIIPPVGKRVAIKTFYSSGHGIRRRMWKYMRR